MTIKIAHIADTHLGYRQYGLLEREEDYYEAFENIIEDIIKKEVDYVLHAGDLFETPRPPIKAILCAQKGFEKLMKHGIPVYVIAGNHDILQRQNTTLPQELFENENFHIISTKNNHYILEESIFLGGLPYLSKNMENRIHEKLLEITEISKEYKWKILMLHGSLQKYFQIEPEFELNTIPDGYDYYAMGHLHNRIMDTFKNGQLSYPGSTEIRTKAELEDYLKTGKGYTLITIDDTKITPEFINLELKRGFFNEIINYPNLDVELEELKNKIEKSNADGFKKPIVNLTIRYGDFDRSEVDEKIKNELGEITLTLRMKFEPTQNDDELINNIEENNLTPEHVIKEKLETDYGEEIATLGLELYKQLSIKDLNNAKEVADIYYNKLFHKEEN
ncbi:DNA repair exonuclease [Methanosphaera sp. WGK6]|uniref:metallophosphoesterase family protein n=1 Tax=Methanosphaera sp. WGK6 TaxID=1561964 RepID=UPI000A0116B6|nr:DNA repair exonuclease [Methanosphaera sp. WGK6]